jgi:hypothetical protein
MVRGDSTVKHLELLVGLVTVLPACASTAPELGPSPAGTAGIARSSASTDHSASPATPSNVGDTPATVESGHDTGAWRFALTPFVWVPGTDGTAGVRGVTFDSSDSIGGTANSLLDYLEAGATLRLEAQSDDVGIIAEVVYLKLGVDEDADVPTPIGPVEIEGEAEFRATIAELAATIPLGDARMVEGQAPARFDGIVGVRYYDVGIDIDLDVPAAGVGASIDDDFHDWIDGFIGARAFIPIADRFEWGTRVDVGGFGIGTSSELAWRLTTAATWQAGESTQLHAGWQILDIDKKRGSGRSENLLDGRLSGPFLAATFEF